MAATDAKGNFIGLVGPVITYKRRDSEKTFLRGRPEFSKEKIKHDPRREGTRQNYREFGGRSTTSKEVRRVLKTLKPVVDYNIAPALAGKLTAIQKLDTESEKGKRNVQLSRRPNFLEGFPLSKKTVFETVVQAPLTCQVLRPERSAQLILPTLQQGENFFPNTNFPFFQVRVSFGIVPDLFWIKDSEYEPHPDLHIHKTQLWQSAWQPTGEGMAGEVVELNFTDPPGTEYFTLLLAIALCYGRPTWNGEVEVVKYVGGGKILKGV